MQNSGPAVGAGETATDTTSLQDNTMANAAVSFVSFGVMREILNHFCLCVREDCTRKHLVSKDLRGNLGFVAVVHILWSKSEGKWVVLSLC